MNVARILKDKGRAIVTASPDTPMAEIVRLLTDNRIGALVVSDREGAIAGIISERDIVRALAASGAAFLQDPVSRHMTREVRTCTEQDTVNHLMEEMTAHRFRHIPVVEDGKLTGIVSIGDVVKLRLAAVELEAALHARVHRHRMRTAACARAHSVSPCHVFGANASERRICAEPGGSGCFWLSCGAHPERWITSNVARTRPAPAAKRSR